jgi:hypothetical protein
MADPDELEQQYARIQMFLRRMRQATEYDDFFAWCPTCGYPSTDSYRISLTAAELLREYDRPFPWDCSNTECGNFWFAHPTRLS